MLVASASAPRCAFLCRFVRFAGSVAMIALRPATSSGHPPHAHLSLRPACMFSYHPPYAAPFSDYGLVAAMCSALGNVNFEGVS